MRRILFLLCIVILFFPTLLLCQERDGSNYDKAIIIKYIGDYEKSIDQEYEYIVAKYSVMNKAWRLQKQSLLHAGERTYDEMIIEILSTKEIIVLYFDITKPFQELEKQLRNRQ